MQYIRDMTLLPVMPSELHLAERVPFRELPDARLLLFDETVSDFFFEFEPQSDIERFLQHAHFACIHAGRLIACHEDLLGVATAQPVSPPPESVTLDPERELPLPLRFSPIIASFAAIRQGGEFQGQLTVCNCGIAGCFSQYAWVRGSVCMALFTVSGACLTEVAWFPLRFEAPTAPLFAASKSQPHVNKGFATE